MDIWVAAGLVLAVLGIIISIYYGRRSGPAGSESALPGPRVIVRVANSMPVYDLPDGSQDIGDHYVSVEAVNTGDRPIAITSWGIELPGGKHIVVTRPVNWATPLPHELRPGAPPARFLVLAEELRRVNREALIAFDDMRPYVSLADGSEVRADRGVPLA